MLILARKRGWRISAPDPEKTNYTEAHLVLEIEDIMSHDLAGILIFTTVRQRLGISTE